MKMLLVLLALLPFSALAVDREVSVSGACTHNVVADRGAIVLTADFTEADLKSAAKKATDTYEHTRDAIKRLNLENLELQTVEYNLAEAKEWVKDRMVSKGFRARMGLKVSTSQTSRLGEV